MMVVSDNLIQSMEEVSLLSERFCIPLSEVLFCELNRTGIWLEMQEVPVNYRARFLCKEVFSAKRSMYFAVPVREKDSSNFWINKYGLLQFKDFVIGKTSCLEIDTCDCSYFRKDKKVLNLNSNRRGNCKGCKYCIHNFPIYDERVLKDTEGLTSEKSITEFFEKEILIKNNWSDLSGLEQIAVVTGLFRSENETINHILSIRKIAKKLGFDKEIFFLGSEITSPKGLERLSECQPLSFCYAIDCFESREERLNPVKAKVGLEKILEILQHSTSLGFRTNFAYIAGLDSIEGLSSIGRKFAEVVSRFPIINIYQFQHYKQKEVIGKNGNRLDYYLKARNEIEKMFFGSGLAPQNWENYRSLWYHYFQDRYIKE